MIDYRLYLVTDGCNLEESLFYQVIEDACKSGVTVVQLREKGGTVKAIYERAKTVKQITDQYNVPLIINDRLDICLAVDAAGIHIGDEELPTAVVRRLVGPQKIVGVSVKTVEQAKQAEKDGADYIGVGSMFKTQTKKTSTVSFDTLKEIKRKVTIPVIAIGGIKQENLETFHQTGIAGVAIVSEIMRASNMQQKVKQLLSTLTNVIEE